jgi:hypothetical protein
VTPLKEALTALADVLAKRPAEEILFEWFRSGRGEAPQTVTRQDMALVHRSDRFASRNALRPHGGPPGASGFWNLSQSGERPER